MEHAFRCHDIGPTLHKAFETAGSVLISVNVDYTDNFKLFKTVDRDNSFETELLEAAARRVRQRA
ncbi:hypothetical protein ASE04_11285 [Rhizobium sp. Root708]|uniref:hypothetical protein n=1 Tax=Rhizobium sp. Root708 TaxID=1736592 RepID=UPI00070108AA|nr:hypothetical protein [Rhizobium sp. Root708]KRB51354.1 hypothetical protein ASE04_11285 [Rhizobium sp. Root708]